MYPYLIHTHTPLYHISTLTDHTMPTAGQPGAVFSHYTVIKPLPPSATGAAMSLCQCDCGMVKPVARSNLLKAARTGRSISCGCHQRARLDAFATAREQALAAKREKALAASAPIDWSKYDPVAVERLRRMIATHSRGDTVVWQPPTDDE